MSYNNFTVTEVTYNFTATVTTPLELTLDNTEDRVTVVTNNTATISVVNTRQPVTVTVAGGGTAFNQSLNTTDNVSFASVTTPLIYGAAGQPVSFPTGISAANFGTTFAGTLDFGSIFESSTNIISLLFAAMPIDMGTIVLQPQYSLEMGGIE